MRYLDHSPKKVALIGMGPSIQDYMVETLTQEFSPDFADEVWAINMASQFAWHDVVFWMDDLNQQDNFKPGLLSGLRRRGKPVITPKAYPEILPNSYDYPINPIALMSIETFGRPYLNNGVAQAIAYAIWKGVRVLKLYGCDFTYPNRNYAEPGRACCESWITLACERKVQVQLCRHTSLFDSVEGNEIYGYAEQPEIKLPDGSAFVFDRQKAGNYKAEDSSGVENDDVSANVSGSPGADSSDAGADGHAGNGLDPVEAAAIARPGESLRSGGEA